MKHEVDIPIYECKTCHKETDTLYYVRYGNMKLNKENEWIDNSDPEDVEYRCPNCNTEINSEELERIGVFA